MNFSSFTRSGPRLARLHYEPSSFRIMSNGDHVLCALSGVPIPLESLRYWSHERQQAYATAALAVEAFTGRRPSGSPAAS